MISLVDPGDATSESIPLYQATVTITYDDILNVSDIKTHTAYSHFPLTDVIVSLNAISIYDNVYDNVGEIFTIIFHNNANNNITFSKINGFLSVSVLAR